jgi:hypothetical protein
MYRLHGGNLSDQKQVKLSDYALRKNKLDVVRHGMKRRMEQAGALIERYGDELDPIHRKIVSDFVAIGSQGFVQRRVTLLKGNYLYPDLPRNLAMLIGV